MATHDYVINDQTTPAFRSDLNSVLSAIVSNTPWMPMEIESRKTAMTRRVHCGAS